MRNFATALNRPNAALWVMLSSILFNLVAAWALIFGHLGLPKLGLTGAGLATSLSAIWAFVIHIFSPFSRKLPSACVVARVLAPRAPDPEPGPAPSSPRAGHGAA